MGAEYLAARGTLLCGLFMFHKILQYKVNHCPNGLGSFLVIYDAGFSFFIHCFARKRFKGTGPIMTSRYEDGSGQNERSVLGIPLYESY